VVAYGIFIKERTHNQGELDLYNEETVLAVAKAAENALGGYQKPPL
jgi:hypothetical protein